MIGEIHRLRDKSGETEKITTRTAGRSPKNQLYENWVSCTRLSLQPINACDHNAALHAVLEMRISNCTTSIVQEMLR